MNRAYAFLPISQNRLSNTRVFHEFPTPDPDATRRPSNICTQTERLRKLTLSLRERSIWLATQKPNALRV
jgi:hypothetical protein